ncbi:MAG: Lar family restriction alleviation protein [Synergistaceae bacterium]|nr:Lar family restriction alleviation protein [Synergistaceae bacterium]MBR1602381.1 Lar family restriction alleviation protein [Synergistaceae bacterium]
MSENKFELKPCPFCGSRDLELYSEENDVLGEVCWESFILCNNCHAHFRKFVTYDSREEAEAEIAELWNTRRINEKADAIFDVFNDLLMGFTETTRVALALNGNINELGENFKACLRLMDGFAKVIDNA